MVLAYDVSKINLGPPSFATGHEAYLNATIDGKRIIYKKNKFGFADFSRLEAAFSHLAKLFLMPYLTSSVKLVVDNNNVVGMAIDHLAYEIQEKEGLPKKFYTLSEQPSHGAPCPKQISDPLEIPIYFLNKLPQGFYEQLIKAEKNNELSIDYSSLASILGTSYTLEEDDLHKGNFGFYMVEQGEKPSVVFFKIDHDLMFVDSIMGFCTRRIHNIFRGSGIFNITVEDLKYFPNLKHSANFYWPTRFNNLFNPFDTTNKEYRHFTENTAFAALEHTDAFKTAKWRTFYKHILMPRKLIEQTLTASLDDKNPSDRALIALVTQAMLARLAHLRAALFCIKEFREYVKGLKEDEEVALLAEVKLTKADVSMDNYKVLIDSIKEGDTPLHTAIKLGEYRYGETTAMFGHFINTKNNEGKTPLDIALELPENTRDISKDKLSIIKHLLEKGAQKTEQYNRVDIDSIIQSHKPENQYKPLITANSSYVDLKELLRDIGEDHQYSLKFKKNLAIECINHWIDVKKDNSEFKRDLEKLKKDVNGTSDEADHAGIKYLRQLRSSLWIVRQLRGLYGWSTTLSTINGMIDKALQSIKPQARASYTMFPPSTSTKSIQEPSTLDIKKP